MKTKGRIAVLAAGMLMLAPVGTQAQDEASALAAVDRIFEGMRTANAAMVREVFAGEARFAMVDAQSGPATVRAQSVEGWLSAIADSNGRWDEQVYDVSARVDGSMASVWAPYTFYLDGEISHCGINSIEMLHDGTGWKVTQISDTRRQSDCPDPLAGGEGAPAGQSGSAHPPSA
jgi:hypothetical protein